MTVTLLLSGAWNCCECNGFDQLRFFLSRLFYNFLCMSESGLPEGVRNGKVRHYRMPTQSAMGSYQYGGHTYPNLPLPPAWQGTSCLHPISTKMYSWIATRILPYFVLCYRHNTYLQECTGQREPTYQLNIHDTKLLFLRFAMEQSFSVDTGGGGRESNIHLIPYIIHTVLYVLNTYVYKRWDFNSSAFWDVTVLKLFLLTSSIEQGPHHERRRIYRASWSSLVRSGWRLRTRWTGRTTSLYWPCTSSHPSAGGLLVLTSCVGCWSHLMPARSHQGVLTSKGTKDDSAHVRAWTFKSLYKRVLCFTCLGVYFWIWQVFCA